MWQMNKRSFQSHSTGRCALPWTFVTPLAVKEKDDEDDEDDGRAGFRGASSLIVLSTEDDTRDRSLGVSITPNPIVS